MNGFRFLKQEGFVNDMDRQMKSVTNNLLVSSKTEGLLYIIFINIQSYYFLLIVTTGPHQNDV